MFLPYITSQLETVSRVDIVCDRYLTHSLKQSTRDRRTHSGTTQRQRVIVGVPIPANWEAFLRSSANKDELFPYLSDCIQACRTGRKVIISIKDETIVSTQNCNYCPFFIAFRFIVSISSLCVHDAHYDYVIMWALMIR